MRFRNIFANSTMVCLSLDGRWLNLYCTKLFTPLKRKEGNLFMSLCNHANSEHPQSQHHGWCLGKRRHFSSHKNLLFPLLEKRNAQRESCLRSQRVQSDKTGRLWAAILRLLQSWQVKKKNKIAGGKGQNPSNNRMGLFLQNNSCCILNTVAHL